MEVKLKQAETCGRDLFSDWAATAEADFNESLDAMEAEKKAVELSNATLSQQLQQAEKLLETERQQAASASKKFKSQLEAAEAQAE
eukprot:2580523-Pleurochrysis_carterae.AAC.1